MVITLDLKSNMDRFIEFKEELNGKQHTCLKSNMDRFIEILYEYKQTLNVCLKSNMDRFIDAVNFITPL